ncbi:MAG: hypothetical protein KME03_16600 [Aphanocapsa lilacina HA4352-LM1]|nr:hypothetical protein [Aphanocapsa lilacina HA4352-LM1]
MLRPTRYGALTICLLSALNRWQHAGTIAGKFALMLQAAEIGDAQREFGADLPILRRGGWYGFAIPQDG